MRYLVLLTLLVFAGDGHTTTETPVQVIGLAPPLDIPEAEISGMAWCGGKLVLQPQYPRRLREDKISHFYLIERADIIAHLEDGRTTPLAHTTVIVNENKLRKKIAMFDGYEAIACSDGTMWLAIEAVNLLNIYHSYLVPASFDFDSEEPSITVYPERLISLDSPSEMRNMGDEAVLVNDRTVLSFHEVNDPRVVDNPRAYSFDPFTRQDKPMAFPHLPFRITDVTDLDNNNRFWAINYKYSGDKFSRQSSDPLAERYGQGKSHKEYYNVERLVEFELKDNSITLVDQAPIQLLMEGVEGRNWEGLARLDDRGFLIATDKHPTTLFGFVPYPQKPLKD